MTDGLMLLVSEQRKQRLTKSTAVCYSYGRSEQSDTLQQEGLAMDASNRLDFVLGKLRIKASELSPGEWRAIVGEMLKEMRPQLKHMLGFRPLTEYLNHAGALDDGYHHLSTDIEKIYWPIGVSAETHCAFIANHLPQLPKTAHEHWLELRQDKKIEQILRWSSLLTREGQIIEWDTRYDIELCCCSRYPALSPHVVAVAGSMNPFFTQDDQKLNELFSHRYNPAISIILGFQRLTRDTKVQRQKFLEDIDQLERSLGAVIERLA